jgi:hypothetical protein
MTLNTGTSPVDTIAQAIGDIPVHHEVHIYLEFHSFCLLVGIGTPPQLLPQASVFPPPEPKGGGHTCSLRRTKGGGGTLACWRGVGESQFGRLEKILALCLLCAVQAQNLFYPEPIPALDSYCVA